MENIQNHKFSTQQEFVWTDDVFLPYSFTSKFVFAVVVKSSEYDALMDQIPNLESQHRLESHWEHDTHWNQGLLWEVRTLVWWESWTDSALMGFRCWRQSSQQHQPSPRLDPDGNEITDLKSDLSSQWHVESPPPAGRRHHHTHLEREENAAIGWPQLLVERERPHLDWDTHTLWCH